MRKPARLGGIACFALVVGCAGIANAGRLEWTENHDEVSAFAGVANADDIESGEPDYLFSMDCEASGEETTVVSDIDQKALGKAIAAGDVPSFTFVIDGKANEDTGGEVADLRFEEMSGVWQYVADGADASPLVGAKAIRIEGTGVGLDLPTDKMAASLKTFKDACDAFEAANDAGEEDNSDTGQ